MKDAAIHPDVTGSDPVSYTHLDVYKRQVLKDMIQLLKDLGIDDNTMIVFTSDNGPHNEPCLLYTSPACRTARRPGE